MQRPGEVFDLALAMQLSYLGSGEMNQGGAETRIDSQNGKKLGSMKEVDRRSTFCGVNCVEDRKQTGKREGKRGKTESRRGRQKASGEDRRQAGKTKEGTVCKSSAIEPKLSA
ncbi:hypothetical protein BD626DRAFT_476935 [Schizophyllum amplum]|uniref:Uncharacterized protein n=1 Tax=Schizophyllum amplum TaxID=97359 RepID=A0A550CZT5_9AGAR|nr:hypothetical protein BD626DRAFT_476935 [Auriculariopsis ampla]